VISNKNIPSPALKEEEALLMIQAGDCLAGELRLCRKGFGVPGAQQAAHEPAAGHDSKEGQHYLGLY